LTTFVRHHLVALFFLLSIPVHGQQPLNISGRVSDAETEEALRFATIRAIATKAATVSSKNGEFVLHLTADQVRQAQRHDSVLNVVVSLVGHTTDTLRLSFKAQYILVALRQQDVRKSVVVVTAEDPAYQIMRSVIARKSEQTDTLDRYTYMLYTKFVAITDTTTAQRSTGLGDSTIFSILESYSRGFVHLPDRFFNLIVQRRQTANIPPSANFVAFGTNISVYDDRLTILGEEIESPFTTDALEDYDLTLMTDKDETVAEILVKPKRNSFKAWQGRIYIDQARRMPLEVRLQPNKAVNLPFDAALKLRQTFTDAYGPVMPEALSIISTASAEILWLMNPRVDVDLETFCYDYDFEAPFDDALFDQRRVELSEDADVIDSSFWDRHMKLPLRPEERAAYGEIQHFMEYGDTVESVFMESIFGWASRAVNRVTRVPFSWYDDFFRYNNINGPYLGFGLQFRPDTTFEIHATLGWGINDKRPFGSAKGTYFVDKAQKWSLDAGVYSLLQRRDDPNIVRTGLITFTTLLFGNDYGDYYYVDGWEAGGSYSWGQYRFLRGGRFGRANSVRLFFRSERQHSARTIPTWSLFNNGATKRANPAILDGSMQSVGGEFFLNYRPERRLSRTGMFLRAEISSPDLWATDFDFSRFEWTGFLRTKTLPLWTMDVQLSAGWSEGEVPPQRFFSLESSVSGIALGSAFRVMSVKEFYGDRYLALSLSHNFGEVIPGLLRIPNLASFGLELIAFGSVGYTEFSPQTLAFTKTLLPSTARTREGTYYEFGIGINRILLLLRLDVNVRLSQRSSPDFRITVSPVSF